MKTESWRFTSIAGVLVAAAACSSPAGPAKVGAQPSWRTASGPAKGPAEPTSSGRSATNTGTGTVPAPPRSDGTTPPPGPPAPVVFAPKGPGVAAYNAPVTEEPPGSPIHDAIAAGLADYSRLARVPAPVADPRLFQAADDIAPILPEDRPISYAVIQFALQHHGVIEPSPHLIPVAGNLDEPEAMLEQLAERLPTILAEERIDRFGIGTARGDGPGRDVVVVFLQASYVRTNPIPRQLDADGRFTIEGTLLGDFLEPAVFITGDDGMVVRQDLETRGKKRFRSDISCVGRRGAQQVEITAHDAAGSSVLANFPVWCGTQVPARVSVQPSADDMAQVSTPAEAEALMWRLVNRDRKQYGLPPLDYSAALSDVARAHSEDMRDHGFVAHISPTTGAPHDRVHRARIDTALVMENIARAYGVGEAQEGLMNSPGHRTNILSDKTTHVGIGFAILDSPAEGRILFVTQLFMRVPPPMAPDQAKQALHAIIAKRPRALAPAADLSAMAQAYADQVLATGMPDKQAAAWRAQALDPLRPGYNKIGTAVVQVSDLEAIDMDDAFSDPWITHYGLGVAKGGPSDSGRDTLYIVLVLAEAR